MTVEIPRPLSIVALAAALGLTLVSATPAAVSTLPWVKITPSGPTPKGLTVAVGTSVTWFNTTPQTHHVSADKNTFPAFSLAVGGSHVFTFKRAGRFPYHVDGRLPGTIVVGGSSASGGSKAASGGACNTLCTYHYAVSVKATRKFEATYDASSGDAGAIHVDLQWTASFPTVNVSAFEDHGRPVVTGAGVRTTARAATQFSVTRKGIGGPCNGTATARAPVDMSLSDGGGSPLAFDIQPVNSSASLDSAVDKAMRAACAGNGISSISLADVPGLQNTKWTVSTTDYLRVLVDGKSAAASHFPLDRLHSGNGFTLEVNALGLMSHCGDGCAERDSLHYTITFTPRT